MGILRGEEASVAQPYGADVPTTAQAPCLHGWMPMPRNAQPHADAPPTTGHRKTVRIAALGDLHCTRMSAGRFQPLFTQISEAADMVLLAGDLTDTGQPEE